ncbi:hypothetical protein F5B20DRAFT_16941 [Whalleya microplaca]|nr:hypothetical protein F5B20DRAFT_16941 [Whalleya microplaca]
MSSQSQVSSTPTPDKESSSPKEGSSSSSTAAKKRGSPPRQPHKWTQFELDAVLALICKRAHLPPRRAPLHMAQRLNEVLGSTSRSVITTKDVKDLLATLRRDHKAAFAYIERQGPPYVLTRAKRRVFERGLDFDGSVAEWRGGRREEEARRKEERVFVGPGSVVRRALGSAEGEGARLRADSEASMESEGRVIWARSDYLLDDTPSRNGAKPYDGTARKPSEGAARKPQYRFTGNGRGPATETREQRDIRRPAPWSKQPATSETRNGDYDHSKQHRDSQQQRDSRPYDQSRGNLPNPAAYSYDSNTRHHEASRPPPAAPYEVPPPAPARYMPDTHPTGSEYYNNYSGSSYPAPSGRGAPVPGYTAPTAPQYHNGYPGRGYHHSYTQQGYAPRGMPTSPADHQPYGTGSYGGPPGYDNQRPSYDHQRPTYDHGYHPTAPRDSR